MIHAIEFKAGMYISNYSQMNYIDFGNRKISFFSFFFQWNAKKHSNAKALWNQIIKRY